MIAAKNNAKRLGFFGALVASTALSLTSFAPAALAAPQWTIDAIANTPTAPGGTATFLIELRNDGDVEADSSLEPIVFSGSLPAGLTVQSVEPNPGEGPFGGPHPWDCSGVVAGEQAFACQYTGTVGTVPPDDYRRFEVRADVGGSVSGPTTASFEIDGGGAPSPGSTVATTNVTNVPAAFGIAAFDAETTADPSGTPFTQAGGHPFAATTSLEFNTFRHPEPYKSDATPVEAIKDIEVDLPPGFFGDPTGVDRCTLTELANTLFTSAQPFCSAASQVGTTTILHNASLGGHLVFGPLPVYNMVPPPDAPARLGFNIAGTIVSLDVTVRSAGDYGLTANLRNVSEGLAVAGSSLTLWGVPAASAHDAQRACPGFPAPWDTQGRSCTSGSAQTAFLRNPTSCTDPGIGLPTTVRIDSWVDPGDFDERTIFSHLPLGYPFPEQDWGPPQGPSNCERVPFDPSIEIEPTTTAADSPTGLKVDLSVPQTSDPTIIGQSDLKKAVVTLPKGMTVNPSSADGLGACTSSQIGLDNTNDPICPNNSKIGTVEIETPALEDSLDGAVYLAAQGDNKFNSLLALYIVAKGQGVLVKLPGHVSPQADGQLITTFDNQPQLPFSNLHLEFFGGPRAALRTPATCGTHTTQSQLSPWARPNSPVNLSDSFQITSGPNGGACANPFNPKLSGGSALPLGGALSPFSLRISREDGSQEISTLDVTTPQGLTAVLKGVPACPQAAIDAAKAMSNPGQGALELGAPACRAASQVGTVVVGAGAGTNPFYVNTGKAYLSGPYKGAPLSLAFLTPAVAGPFDLGNVVVQTAIHVNPVTAQITADSDPLPSILHGIPLDLRDVRVNLNRPNFTLNPTSCKEMSIDAALTSTQGASANVSQRFQLAECGSLGFKPKLTLRLRGRTNRGAHPALTAILRPRPGDANLSRVSVALPKSEFLDQAHIRTICTRADFAASNCPRGAIYGQATVTTPLFDQKLTGPVYLRSSSNLLPDLVPDLRGPAELPIRIESAGRVDEVNGGIRNTFDVIPDAPFTKLVLRLKGGNKGLLQNSRNICKQTYRATVEMDGQNGKVHDFKPALKASCGRKGKRAKHNRGASK